MSRDTEKLLKELQSFLMQHGDEAADEDSMIVWQSNFYRSRASARSMKTLRRKQPTIIWILRSRPHPERSASSIFTRRWNWSRTMLTRSSS